MFREGLRPPDPFRDRPALERLETQEGMTLATLSGFSPVIVICLPAFDHKDCARVMTEVAAARPALEDAGARLALVHMAANDDDAKTALATADLQYVIRIGDPGRELYATFEIGETTGRRMLVMKGEPQQLPGAVLLQDAEVRAAIRPASFGEPMDYASLL